MARLPRLAIAGQLVQALQRGHDGEAVFRDAEDARALLSALREAAALHRVAVHAYALLPSQLHLLATPESADGLGLLMQSAGRRYVPRFNARHGRRGTLWDGRFRSTVVEAERHLRTCEVYVETAPVLAGLAEEAEDYPWSSAAHHLGSTTERLVQAHPLDWQLGNTPFEREVARKMLLRRSLPAVDRQRIADAVAGGWALGGAEFVAKVEELVQRRAQPGRPGRPRRSGPAGETIDIAE